MSGLTLIQCIIYTSGIAKIPIFCPVKIVLIMTVDFNKNIYFEAGKDFFLILYTIHLIYPSDPLRYRGFSVPPPQKGLKMLK